MNLGPAGQNTSRRDELLSRNPFVGREAQQGDPQIGFDRRQHSKVSHAQNYGDATERGYARRGAEYANRQADSSHCRGTA